METSTVGSIRKNEPNNITLKANSYYLPGNLVIGKPAKHIKANEFRELVLKGAKWQQLEKFYLVSQDDLKPHLELTYDQAEAELQIELLGAMVATATNKKEPNAQAQKWLSQNWLGMSERAVTKEPEQVLSEAEIDMQLANLISNATPKSLKTLAS